MSDELDNYGAGKPGDGSGVAVNVMRLVLV